MYRDTHKCTHMYTHTVLHTNIEPGGHKDIEKKTEGGRGGQRYGRKRAGETGMQVKIEGNDDAILFIHCQGQTHASMSLCHVPQSSQAELQLVLRASQVAG